MAKVTTLKRFTEQLILMMQNMLKKSFVRSGILKSWDKNWNELTTFFEYPQEIRKIIALA